MKKAKKTVITLSIVLALAIPVYTSLVVAGGGGSLPPIITMLFLR